MVDFEIVFYTIFSALLLYHVLYFLVQYFVFRRIELLYYSIFLLTVVSYYFLFHTPQAFNISFKYFEPVTGVDFSFAFIIPLLYYQFISAYLNLRPGQKAYEVIKYTCYWYAIMAPFFIVTGLAGIDTRLFFFLLSFIQWPLTFVTLYLLWRVNTVHSRVILWGTSASVFTTLLSYFLHRYELFAGFKFPFYNNTPTQLGLIIDLFILGYGLSLKAAESDRKLVTYLIENQKLLEQERGRFARDLHDGLGGLLSSVKFSFINFRERIAMDTGQQHLFEQLLKTLDIGIAELRGIAHNMLPENLKQFGIDVALKDFCFTMQQSGSCHIHYESFGLNQHIAHEVTDTAVYRIAQELINNALKHADASQIIVQLQKYEHRLSLTVEDNGKGFSKDVLKTAKGSGWRSIESRVNLLKGQLVTESGLHGTSVIIDIPTN